jgi:hypothetical protein
MRMPPPGQRYVAAAWIAVTGAVATVIVGSTVVLAVRDSLPDDIVLKWDDLEPDLTTSLGGALALGATLTMVSCLAVLAIGAVMARSVTHGLAGYATGVSLSLGIGFYAVVLTQAGTSGGGSFAVVFGLPGAAIGAGVSHWVRAAAPATHPMPPEDELLLDLPSDARLAWSAWTRPSLSSLLVRALLMAIPIGLYCWWVGLFSGVFALLVSIAFVAGLLSNGRRRQLAIDYSGIGLRGRSSYLPSPIFPADVHSAEATSISALRDFGGWGNLTAPDGRQGWITRSGEALVVHRHTKPDFVFTVDGAGEAAAVLNTLVARLRAQTFVDLPHPYGDRMPTASDQ